MTDESVKSGKLFVISGPSGSGKGTLTRALIESSDVVLSVSATTREKGVNEVDGRDYFFISKEDFKAKIAAGELLEYAEVFDNYYGTPAGPVKQKLSEGETVILEIDIQGGLQVFENMPEAKGVLILPPSEQELERRLVSRGRDEMDVIAKRLEKARWEIETARKSGKYQVEIINDDLDSSIAKLIEVVVEE